MSSLILVERSAWWMHIIDIYLLKLSTIQNLHILLAFPNTYFLNLNPKGQIWNNPNVTAEVQLMMDPNADPFAAGDDTAEVEKFGASDVMDLNRIQLLNAYTPVQSVVVVPASALPTKQERSSPHVKS